MSGRITTHVLDTAVGKPAAGMRLELYGKTSKEGTMQRLAAAATNADGRLDAPLLEGESMIEGEYELRFMTGDYFKEKGAGETSIWQVVPIRFSVRHAGEHYHIPLLIAPGGYSTYRGS